MEHQDQELAHLREKNQELAEELKNAQSETRRLRADVTRLDDCVDTLKNMMNDLIDKAAGR